MSGLVEIRPQHQPADPPAGPQEPPTPLDEHLHHFHRRVLVDALLEATATYWLRRSLDFAYVGTDPCDQIALACRRRSDLTREIGLDAEATAILDQVAPQIASQAAPWE